MILHLSDKRGERLLPSHEGAPLRGRTGTSPAHRITQTRAGPKFPQRAKRAEGLDIILDYVKVERSETRRRKPARARSENGAILGSRARRVTRAKKDFFP